MFAVFVGIFICWLKVDVPQGEGVSKVRVNVKHDIHGMFHVQSAEMMKEVVKVKKIRFLESFISVHVCVCHVFCFVIAGFVT